MAEQPKDYTQDTGMKSNMTVNSSMLNTDSFDGDATSTSPVQTAPALTDSMKFEGTNEVDSRPIVTGGVVRTAASPTRVQLSQIVPQAPLNTTLTKGDEDPALYVLKDAVIRLMMSVDTLAFFNLSGAPVAQLSNDASQPGLIVFAGTPPAFNGYVFNQTAFYPNPYTSDLGTNFNRWGTLYVNNISGLSSVNVNSINIGSVTILSGSGAPTIAAPQGSLYLRTNGTTTNDRAYINTTGGGGAGAWTAIITAT